MGLFGDILNLCTKLLNPKLCISARQLFLLVPLMKMPRPALPRCHQLGGLTSPVCWAYQLEAKVINIHPFQANDSFLAGVEVRIIQVYMEESLLAAERRHYVDTEKLRPLIMSFCEFYGLGEQLQPSKLAKAF